MADIRVIQWGGTEYDSTSGGSAIEVWSCSMHILAGATADPINIQISSVSGYLRTYHTAAGTNIHSGSAIEFVKMSDVDPATGHWTTDPVNQVLFSTLNRGASSSGVPLAQSCRISLDDGTRNRRAKGGFFLPRYAASVGINGRYSTSPQATLQTTTSTLMNSLNALTGVDVGVYSRAAAGFFPSTQFRIGDVPDNIRTRKNKQRETYLLSTI